MQKTRQSRAAGVYENPWDLHIRPPALITFSVQCPQRAGQRAPPLPAAVSLPHPGTCFSCPHAACGPPRDGHTIGCRQSLRSPCWACTCLQAGLLSSRHRTLLPRLKVGQVSPGDPLLAIPKHQYVSCLQFDFIPGEGGGTGVTPWTVQVSLGPQPGSRRLRLTEGCRSSLSLRLKQGWVLQAFRGHAMMEPRWDWAMHTGR